jgi:SAM-dependent methyltransferase
VVQTAQALHWFDRPAFYAEVGRVLVPGGFLFVLYNDRDPDAPLIREFEALMEGEIPDYSRHYRSFDYPAELAGLSWAIEATSNRFKWVWRLAPEDFAELMLSRSLAKPWTRAVGEAEARARLTALARSHGAADGSVLLPYFTRLAQARRGPRR